MGLGRYLSERGVNAMGILQLSGLQNETVYNRYSRFPADRLATALELAEDALGDPCIGLHFGEWYTPPILHRCNFAINNAPNLRSAMDCLIEHRNFVAEMPAKLDECGHLALFSWNIEPGYAASRHVTDFKALRLLKHIRKAAGPGWKPLNVEFTHEQPADVSEYRNLLGPRLAFGKPQNGFCFSAELLDLPMHGANPDIFNLASATGAAPHPVSNDESDILWRVRRFIGMRLDSGHCTLEEAAACVGMSAQRLSRHLRKRGTSFQWLVDDIRRTFAEHYLSHSNLPCSQIALMLGFSEQSAFTRAVKRWFDATPREVRRNTK